MFDPRRANDTSLVMGKKKKKKIWTSGELNAGPFAAHQVLSECYTTKPHALAGLERNVASKAETNDLINFY